MKQKGVLIIISGFAGSGKGTITKQLITRYDNYSFSVSATTRDPRPGELNGKDYFFISKDKFEQMIVNDEFLEFARYVGNYYGTPKAYVEQMLEDGKDVILEIDCQGAFNARKVFPEALLCFITPPSVEDVYKRLKGRGTEPEDVILKRIKRGRVEADIMGKYDFIIINDDLETAINRIHSFIQDSKTKPEMRGLSEEDYKFIEKLKFEFDEFLECI